MGVVLIVFHNSYINYSKEIKMKPYKIYADILENDALDQFNDAMSQDFVISGSLMPDAHTGYSLPIGAVVATDGVIVPAWVGYDIGCGMCALALPEVSASDVDVYSKDIYDLLYESIPVGFKINDTGEKYSLKGLSKKGKEIALRKNHHRAIGSLGGGNHFIEVGLDGNGCVWVVIHSGSRGVGHGIAAHYMTKASSDPEKIGIEFDAGHAQMKIHNPEQYDDYKSKFIEKKMGKLRPKEGHYYFDVNSISGVNYIKDMNWCLDFALENRKEMMMRVICALAVVSGRYAYTGDFSELINRNHNHATQRDGLWIHRKGATHAEKGMMGIIPGNMRDGSFIVRGKGNSESLWSSSHGAGRVMSRKRAKKEINQSDFIASMQGITAKVDESTLDESPEAYKNIFDVMRLQEDLVEIVAHIKPIVNIKG